MPEAGWPWNREAGEWWMKFAMYRGWPLAPKLSGLPLEYRVVHIYADETGSWSGVIEFDVGQGTQDLGFDGTEMRTTDGDNTAEVVKAIEKTGLTVHGIVNGSDSDIVKAIEVSKSLGGTSVLTLCRYDKAVSLQENWDRDIANIRKSIPAAQKHGIKMLVENVWASYLISAFDVRSFLDEIDSPWVGS